MTPCFQPTLGSDLHWSILQLFSVAHFFSQQSISSFLLASFECRISRLSLISSPIDVSVCYLSLPEIGRPQPSVQALLSLLITIQALSYSLTLLCERRPALPRHQSADFLELHQPSDQTAQCCTSCTIFSGPSLFHYIKVIFIDKSDKTSTSFDYIARWKSARIKLRFRRAPALLLAFLDPKVSVMEF